MFVCADQCGLRYARLVAKQAGKIRARKKKPDAKEKEPGKSQNALGTRKPRLDGVDFLGSPPTDYSQPSVGAGYPILMAGSSYPPYPQHPRPQPAVSLSSTPFMPAYHLSPSGCLPSEPGYPSGPSKPTDSVNVSSNYGNLSRLVPTPHQPHRPSPVDPSAFPPPPPSAPSDRHRAPYDYPFAAYSYSLHPIGVGGPSAPPADPSAALYFQNCR